MPLDAEAVAATLQDLARSIDAMQQQSTSAPIATQATDREEGLRRELDQVRAVNSTLTTVISSISTSTSNLAHVVRTAQNLDDLLSLWMRVLSQTEHTQRLVFDPRWEGATKDEEVHALRVAKLAEQRAAARERAEREREAKEAEGRRRGEVEEQKRRREALLHKRVYGNKTRRLAS
ncbi:DASH complex subunit Duo1-domain-containing protein [Limtongia smithiae]|uniref:DASH complex subunit Duo1-domain-containing protein n=1 Tax=Limtongia smithiae TaxID=1125753 RepID=UPI0034CE31B0